ncbi:hypothetical protein GCM10008967_27230 [Bacillus carboniphilus]|uniref:Uncharacterized protein n=1 Tax=Bacillus carboniphilus TaxID=86663 RepID=A0ABP3G4U9_9BACI
MVFFFYVFINLLVLYLFVKMKKKLHILEIMVYWMVASYLFQNFSALCYMNFKTLIIKDILSIEFTHFINRIILYPVVLVMFLIFYRRADSLLHKFSIFISFLLILVGLEWSADYLGVITHVNWRIWWSFSFWFFSLLFLVVVMKLFRRVLFQGGLNI